MDDNTIDWDQFKEIEEKVSKDPEGFGNIGNIWNPNLNIWPQLEGITSFQELISELGMMISHVSTLYAAGWELDGEIAAGTVKTFWNVEDAEPPIEDSAIVDGYDLEGEYYGADED